MLYRVTHTTKYAYTEPVPICQNKLHLTPRDTDRQTCQECRLLVVPEPAALDTFYDFFGNSTDYFSLVDSHRGLAITSCSTVEVNETEAAPPADAAVGWEEVSELLAARPPKVKTEDSLFAYGSEYARPAEMLKEYAKPSFAPGRGIVDAAMDLTGRIFDDFEYNPRATNISTPVAQVFEQKAGVCQDFAHLQLACLRSLGLAARYVSGYLRTEPPPGKPRLVGADASHAWVSVYCGSQGWIDFDPTNNVIPAGNHITLAYGRDYGDVCPIQGVFVGGGDHSMSVSVDVQKV